MKNLIFYFIFYLRSQALKPFGISLSSRVLISIQSLIIFEAERRKFPKECGVHISQLAKVGIQVNVLLQSFKEIPLAVLGSGNQSKECVHMRLYSLCIGIPKFLLGGEVCRLLVAVLKQQSSCHKSRSKVFPSLNYFLLNLYFIFDYINFGKIQAMPLQ